MDLLQQFGVTIADTDERRTSVRILLCEMFRRRGYTLNQRHEDSNNCLTFISSNSDQTLGTVSLCTESYPALETFPDEISLLQKRGAKLCEIGKLAFLPSTNSKTVFAALLHIIFLYAKYRFKKTDAIIQVNPRHAGYYEKMLGFRSIGDVRINKRVRAPARLLWLNLNEMDRRIQQRQVFPTERDRSLYPYFFPPDVADGIRSRIVGEEVDSGDLLPD